MPQFSENDINEAKRRVWEMRNRASQYVDDRQDSPPPRAEKKQTEPPKQQEQSAHEKENEDLPSDKSFYDYAFIKRGC